MAIDLLDYLGVRWRLSATHHQHGLIQGVNFEGRRLFVLVPTDDEEKEKARTLDFQPSRYATGEWSAPWIALTLSCGCEKGEGDSVALLVSLPPDVELADAARGLGGAVCGACDPS